MSIILLIFLAFILPSLSITFVVLLYNEGKKSKKEDKKKDGK